MDLLTRKTPRLSGFDYSQPGAYFITICTKDRQNLLCKIVGDDAHIVPSHFGFTVEKFIRSIPGIDKYVIMPNHIHLILIIAGESVHDRADVGIGPKGRCGHRPLQGGRFAGGCGHPPLRNRQTPTNVQTVSQRIRSFKTLVTKETGTTIFQRSFYDHIIRDEDDYLRIWNYIDTNPAKWKEDRFYNDFLQA